MNAAQVYTIAEENGTLTEFVPDAEHAEYLRAVKRADMRVVSSAVGRGGYYVTTEPKP